MNGPNRNAGRDRPKITEFFGKAEGGIKKNLPPDNFFFSLLCAIRSRFDEANRNAKWRSENSVPPDLLPNQTDKCVLTIAQPKRLRDKSHLKFVASQACLVCGRQPCDPHHLRFAQPKAIGLKVSDEFTVPLCRGHHRQVHQAGNEVAWWEKLNINALEIVERLSKQTRTKLTPEQTDREPHLK
ncbi:MAG: hypothetical protein WBX05_08475 [Pseudolabrys sp.]